MATILYKDRVTGEFKEVPLGGTGSGVKIDDSAPASHKTYSSQKIEDIATRFDEEIGSLNEEKTNRMLDSMIEKKIEAQSGDVVEGTFINADGVVQYSGSYVSTKPVLIDFDAGSIMDVHCCVVGGCAVVILDGDNNVLLGIDGNNAAQYGITASVNLQTVSVLVPDNAKSIRMGGLLSGGGLTVPYTQPSDLWVRGHKSVTVNVEQAVLNHDRANSEMFVEGYTHSYKFNDVTKDLTKHAGEYCYNSGGKVASVAIATWDWFEMEVTPEEIYRLVTRFHSTPRAYFLTNENGDIIEQGPAYTGDGNVPQDYSGEFVIPNGVCKMYINAPNSAYNFKMSLYRADLAVPRFIEKDTYAIKSDPLYGKKLAACGDSITQATNPNGGYFKNYAELVAERHAMSYYRDGIGGSTMANVEGNNPFCVNRYLKVPADFDILTIWFGWNDASYATVGTIEDTEDTTFYGAYKKVLEHLITTYPTKKIGLIVPYGNASVEPFRVAVRTLSEMYGVPCLDLADGKQCSLLWGTANAAQEARRAALTYDSTHPNQAGHEYLSTMYEEFIKRL